MKNKILYRFLPVFLSVFCLFVFSPIVSQAESLEDIPWDNTASTVGSSYTYYLTPSAGSLSSLTSSSAYVNYNIYPEFILNFRFSAQDTIFKYPVTNLLYEFNLSCNDVNLSIHSAEYYLIHNGTEYLLSSYGNYSQGWLQKLFIYNTNTYFDIKVVLKANQFINQNFTRAQYDADTTIKNSKSYSFMLTLDSFYQYDSEDNMSVMSNNIEKLLTETEGVKGAIDNQTEQAWQNSQNEINQSFQNTVAQIDVANANTDKVVNGYNSSQMGEVENKFEDGAGDLTSIEDDLTDSSSKYVNDFTTTGFDTSFLTSVGPSLEYVVTWFTNFWNMGGALTSTYGLSFAIFIAFYILRVRG